MLRMVARRERDRGGDAVERTGDEGDVGGFDGDVGAGADRETDVGLREGGGVVDAVADHADEMAFALQAPDLERFVFGQHFGAHASDPDLAGDRGRGAAVVAGDHDDIEAEVLSAATADAEPSLMVSATAITPAGCPSTATNIGVLPCSDNVAARSSSGRGRDRGVLEEPRVADEHLVSVDGGADAFAGDGVETDRVGECQCSVGGARDDCRRRAGVPSCVLRTRRVAATRARRWHRTGGRR